MWRLGRCLLATAIAPLVLGLFGLVVPRLLYPPLSAAQLQQVPPEKRIELQQAQDRMRNDAGATLLQGAAGALLVLGVVATWRQVQVSREGQITERFSRAIDHLGADKPDVRLGGLYTLERIDASISRQLLAGPCRRPVRVGGPSDLDSVAVAVRRLPRSVRGQRLGAVLVTQPGPGG